MQKIKKQRLNKSITELTINGRKKNKITADEEVTLLFGAGMENRHKSWSLGSAWEAAHAPETTPSLCLKAPLQQGVEELVFPYGQMAIRGKH